MRPTDTCESQLIIDRSFVLRHLGKGFGAEVLNSTLLADQLQRQSAAIREKADTAGLAPLPEGVAAVIERYNQLDASLKGTENQFIRLSAKQQKEAEKEMKGILDQHGADFERMREQYMAQTRDQTEIEHMASRLRLEWEDAYHWLMQMGFIEWHEGDAEPDPAAPGQTLTPRGYACAAFADGHPLILGMSRACRGVVAWGCAGDAWREGEGARQRERSADAP